MHSLPTVLKRFSVSTRHVAEMMPFPLHIMPKNKGANAKCYCGSGKKYKKCHRDQDRDAGKDRACANLPAATADAMAFARDLVARQVEAEIQRAAFESMCMTREDFRRGIVYH